MNELEIARFFLGVVVGFCAHRIWRAGGRHGRMLREWWGSKRRHYGEDQE